MRSTSWSSGPASGSPPSRSRAERSRSRTGSGTSPTAAGSVSCRARSLRPRAGAQHAFKDWLKDQLGSPLTSRFAYMACLPYTPVSSDWQMAGIPRGLIIDQAGMGNCAAQIRHAIEQEAQGGSALAAKFLERILPRHSPGAVCRRCRQRQDVACRREGTASGQGRPAGGPVLLQQGTGRAPAPRGLHVAAGQAGLRRRVPRVRQIPRHPRRRRAGILRSGHAPPAQGTRRGPGRGDQAGCRRRRRSPGLRPLVVGGLAGLPEEARRRRGVRLHGRAAERLRPVGRRTRRRTW